MLTVWTHELHLVITYSRVTYGSPGSASIAGAAARDRMVVRDGSMLHV